MKNTIWIFVWCLLMSNFSMAQNPTIQRGHERFNFFVEVYHKEKNHPITDALVYLYEMPQHQLVDYTYTSAKGVAEFQLDYKKSYQVETCKQLFLNGFAEIFRCDEAGNILCLDGFSTFTYLDAGGTDKPIVNFHTSIEVDSIVVGKTFTLDNIYYDLDKWHIRRDAKPELDKLVRVLKRHPSISIELGSHTDSRGSDDYNETLSQKRANSCVTYLVDNGIAPHRITAKGYGESILLNQCEDGIACSESKHQSNRRTEFKILSFEGEECVIPGQETALNNH